MPAGQEATRSFAAITSLGRLAAQALLCGLLFWPLAGHCKDSSTQAASGKKPTEKVKPIDRPKSSPVVDLVGDGSGAVQILPFPTAYSAGSLYKLKRGHDAEDYLHISRKFFAQARGNVAVPKGMLLSLTVSYQGGEDLAFLDRLPPGVVAFVKLERLPVTDQQFRALKCITDLKGLELTDVDITDRGIMQFQNCHDLVYAALKSMVITGKGMVAFRNLHKLRHLDCEQDMLDDASMGNLSGLTNLIYLRLKDVRITDAGLKHLLPLTDLVELNLSINKITDAGIASLLPLKKLRMLDLTDTKVTIACLDSLVKFPNLHELTISQLDFTPGQLEEIRRRLPHCRIADGKKTGADLRIFEPLH